MTLISNLAFGQVSADTITNWQIYKDSVLILSGNEVMQSALLPITTVDTQYKFENLRIDFLYDFYSGDIERKIDFYLDDKQIGEFKDKGSARESINIPKDFIDQTFKNHLDKQLLVKYTDNKYHTTGIPIGLIIFSKSNCITRQDIEKLLIETGEFKNYYRYDLGDFYFYNGRYENNLTYKILQKKSGIIIYTRKDSLSDAMILKPDYFGNYDKSTILIMIEVAAEYSWGQEIILIKNQNVHYLGYMDYTVNKDNGESISDYCDFLCENGKLTMIFKDLPIIYWPDEPNILNGKDLKFEITENEIKRIK
ncbi:MAG: hypothetical protein IPH20_01765 [Bacteroidales bacterium]|nr:hypothetical protein [Bacteroidales bacterium]